MQEWCAKKYTDKEGYKSEGKYTKPHPYIFTLLCKDVGMDEALYIDLHFYILPCLCTFQHTIPTSLFIFNNFSVLYSMYEQSRCEFHVHFCSSMTCQCCSFFKLSMRIATKSGGPTVFLTHHLSMLSTSLFGLHNFRK